MPGKAHTAKPPSPGTVGHYIAQGAQVESSSIREEKNFAVAGTSLKGAMNKGTYMNVPDADRMHTARKTALERRRLEPLTPYKAHAWQKALPFMVIHLAVHDA